MNDHAIYRLFEINGFKTEKLPTIEYGDVETPDLGTLGNYIQVLAGAGVPLFPDDNLENYLRGLASLPEKRESAKGDMATAQAQESTSKPKNQEAQNQQEQGQDTPEDKVQKIIDDLLAE